MKEILRASHIKKEYIDKPVLEDINLNLHQGEIVCLLGVSGVGKTTLFNILSGLMIPDNGNVFLANDSVDEKTDDGDLLEDITGKPGHISYMLQKDLLLPHKTVIDNVSLPLVLNGMNKKEAREKAASFFERFGLSGTEKKYPVQLSGGMKQRAALLRTYLCQKPVALLDEPFGALDTLTREAIHEWYLKIMEEIKLSTIFITHDIDEAILISDRILILKGSPASITDEIIIGEPKPREGSFVLTDKFLEYKRLIKSKL
ncbi:MAG: ABC transporter ATP-binding protein [Lachnospiraceae bacterium]|nr:ABC transporter ATP-binding protein [Lachnospiraceae bacterium]